MKPVSVQGIEQTIQTTQELFNSNEWNNLWKGISRSDRERKERILSKGHFEKAFITESGEIWYLVNVEGLRLLHKARTTSMLTARPFQVALIDNITIPEETLLVMIDSYVENTTKNRSDYANTGIILTKG